MATKNEIPEESTERATEGLYRIPADNLPALNKRLEKLTKRAAKLGVEPISLRVVETEDQPVWSVIRKRGTYKAGEAAIFEDEETAGKFSRLNSQGPVTKSFRRWLHIEVFGVTPQVAGWKFVATIQHAGEAGNILRTVPNETVPMVYRNAPSTNCEHCNKSRNRRDTYIVKNVTDETFKQVGSNCLTDFLGGADPHAIAAWAELLGAFDESMRGAGEWDGSIHKSYADRDSFLVHVAANIRANGWVSKKIAWEQRGSGKIATAVSAAEDYYEKNPVEAAAAGKFVPVEDVDLERAAKAMQWAETNLLEVDPTTLGDYLFNLRVACASEVVEPRSFGILASLIVAAEREGAAPQKMGTKIEGAGPASEHIGEIKKRTDLVLTVESVRTVETNDMGTVGLHIMKTAEGSVVKWWNYNSTDLEVGKTYKVRCTPQRHEEYKGRKETTVNRVVAIEVPSYTPEAGKPGLMERLGVEG